MSTSLPPPPTSGNGKYIAFVAVLAIGIVALILFKTCGKEPVAQNTPPPIPSTPATQVNPKVDDVPPPPPEEPDAGPTPHTPNTTTARTGCEAKTCSGQTTGDLETALAFRAKQAHRCYDTALAQDTSLQGHVSISVRIGTNGAVCAANVASNDMGTPAVAQCVANVFRASGHFPAPKSGCVDATVPIAFVPGGR